MTRLLCVAATVLVAFSSAPAAGDVMLAKAGKTDYTIVISLEASPSEKHGAEELQAFLKEITGAEFPVRTEAASGPMILVGDSPALASLKLDIPWQKLGQEGFVIKTVDPHLVLAGGRLRGSMYAVYTFLEDCLGCRWFSSKVSHIPYRRRLAVPNIDVQQVPRFEYREDFYTGAFDADFAARNRMNGCHSHLDEARGGKVGYCPFVHSFYTLLPPEQYFAEHPEYYSMIDGKRPADHTQLCLTNPEVVRLVTEKIKEMIRQHPGATIHSVAQNDWGGWCECPNCKALDEREGTHAATVIDFVNQIAEGIEKEFPGHAIDTLAYQYTRKPPKTIKPRENVIVRLCSIECCFAHPLDSCPVNASFRDDIVGWSKLTDRLYIWDYVTDFAHYIMPFPNLRALKPNIEFFADHGVAGIFEEGNYAPGGGGEMAELRAYLLAKLLWNPDYDQEKAIHEFLQYYYGPAAEPIHKYLRAMHDKVEKDNIHVVIWTGPDAPYLSDDMLKMANELFDEAERACAGRRQFLERVQVVRLPLQYVALRRGPRLRFDGEALNAAGREGYLNLLDEFMRVARQAGITQIREGADISGFEAEMRERAPASYPALKVENAALEFVFLPGLGGRIFSLRDKASGRDLVYQPGMEFATVDEVDGYEEYLGEEYRHKGWLEEYQAKQETLADGTKVVTLWADMQPQHGRMTREIRIPAQGARFSIESSLTNIGDHADELMLRVHPAFACRVLPSTRVVLRQADGRWKAVSLPLEGQKDQFFTPQQAGGGEWAVVQPTEGWALVQRFDPSEVAQLLLNSDAGVGRVNPELFSKTVELPPGETIRLSQSYEFVTDLAPWQGALAQQ